MHVGKKITNFVNVFAAEFDLVDLQNLVAFVKEAGSLGRASTDDPADDDGLALVLDGRTQRLVSLLDSHDLGTQLRHEFSQIGGDYDIWVQVSTP